MPKQSSPKVKSLDQVDGGGRNEVGRIVLGERLFTVALASDRSTRQEICRFEVGGMSLAVFEEKDELSQKGLKTFEDLTNRLTGRELEIAVLVAQGFATKNIAYRLQISEWTVATYLRRIFAKLDVYSRAAMVYRCASLIDRAAEILPSAQQVDSSLSAIRKVRSVST
jgi:DNA-binding CsgD family transcriptional regulator